MSKKSISKFVRPVPTLPEVMPEFYAGPGAHNFPGEPHAKRLMQMFTYKRPYMSGNGLGYRTFIDTFIMPVAKAVGAKAWMDSMHNVFIDMRSDEKHRTMFTAHTDSVHRTEGRQTVAYDPESGLISVLDGECLGADDAAGVALMLHMIESGVAGMYVFPAGEEVGGVGSRFIAQDVDFLSQFDRAIAFDRRGDYSIITHQMGGRCCSDEFALALAEALDSDALMFSPDQTGTYTDTAEFTEIIPECTNLSIGYMSEHTAWETMSLRYFQELAHQIIRVDFDALPVVRDPMDMDEDEWLYWTKGNDMQYWEDSITSNEVLDAHMYDLAYEALCEAFGGDFDSLIRLLEDEVIGECEDDTLKHTVLEARITQKVLEDFERELNSFGAFVALEYLHDTVVAVTYH